MTKQTSQTGAPWTCPHGFVTGFFPVPGRPMLIEHRSCGICCDEISERISPRADGEKKLDTGGMK